jgi:hypothetical protein
MDSSHIERAGGRAIGSWQAGRLVPLSLGLVLLAAAFFKGTDPATLILPAGGFQSSKYGLVALIEAEAFLGLWLITGIYPRASRLLAILSFSCFSLVSLTQAMSGQESCHCFGRHSVNPWLMLSLDIVALALLSSWSPVQNGTAGRSRPWTFALLVLLFLPLAAFSGHKMLAFDAVSVAADGRVAGSTRVAVFLPSQWIGKKLPLLDQIDIGHQLEKGNWIAILYRSDCEKCRNEIRRIVSAARENKNQKGQPRIAFVAVTPTDGPEALELADPSVGLWGSLTGQVEWLVETPTVLNLRDGFLR